VNAATEEGRWAWVFAPRGHDEKRYWLVKSEPDVFSFDDLRAAPKQTTQWDGVRNFAARNFLRDGMKRGDRVFFYHSSTNPQAIVGICEVAREAYADPTATDKKHPGFDAKSRADDPTWFAVDIRAVSPLPRPVTLTEIKANKALANMALVRIGRLSVTPVTAAEWETILAMANGNGDSSR
jgi:predicted RNA-binding protein with PUA-like domain